MKIVLGMTVRDEMGLVSVSGGVVEKIEPKSYDAFEHDRWGEQQWNLCHVRVGDEVLKIAEDRLTAI